MSLLCPSLVAEKDPEPLCCTLLGGYTGGRPAPLGRPAPPGRPAAGLLGRKDLSLAPEKATRNILLFSVDAISTTNSYTPESPLVT